MGSLYRCYNRSASPLAMQSLSQCLEHQQNPDGQISQQKYRVEKLTLPLLVVTSRFCSKLGKKTQFLSRWYKGLLLQQERRTKKAATVPGNMKADTGGVPVRWISTQPLPRARNKAHRKNQSFLGKKAALKERKARKEKIIFGKSNQKGDFNLHTILTQKVPHLSLVAYCFLLMGNCKFVPFPDSKYYLAAKANSRKQVKY